MSDRAIIVGATVATAIPGVTATIIPATIMVIATTVVTTGPAGIDIIAAVGIAVTTGTIVVATTELVTGS